MTDENPEQHDQDSEPGSAPAGAAAASDTAPVSGSDASEQDQDAGPASVPAGAARPADADQDEAVDEAVDEAKDG